jgi:hypothetical protein
MDMTLGFSDRLFNLRQILVLNCLTLALIALIPGFAAGDESVNFLYQPTGFGRGGSGDLYLSQKIMATSDRLKPVQWIIGDTKNQTGDKTGNIVTARPPLDTVMDAFTLEFKGAGYNVIQVDTLPAGVKKGVILESVAIKLEEVDKLYKVETTCTVKISFETWRNGSAIKKLDYENSFSDSTILDRDMILLKTMQTALQELMVRMVREASLSIEQK